MDGAQEWARGKVGRGAELKLKRETETKEIVETKLIFRSNGVWALTPSVRSGWTGV